MDRVRQCDGNMTRTLSLVTCGRCLKKMAATADRATRRAAGEQVPVNGSGYGRRDHPEYMAAWEPSDTSEV